MPNNPTHDPHAWASSLFGLHEHVWGMLTRGVADRRASTRHPTLATVSVDAKPQARTVVLRSANKGAATLEVHTDLRAAKIADLTHSPFASLHVWDPSAHLQMRLQATATILTRQASQDRWLRVPEAARVSYGTTTPPGHPIQDALDYTKAPDFTAFTVLVLQVEAMDILHLGQNHRRAQFSRSDGWAGQWLAP